MYDDDLFTYWGLEMLTKEQVAALFGMMNELLDRVVRTETRVVNVMKAMELDPYTGKPLEKKDGKS